MSTRYKRDAIIAKFPMTPFWVALVLTFLVSAALLMASWNRGVIPKLRAAANGAREPDCMTVIPARNEEAVIARAVRSLPHDSVIVVDDHSEDATAEAARKAGAGVIRAPELPRGALAKSNACIAGARALQSKWILFADADTWFEPGFLNAAVALAESAEVSFLSLHLDMSARGLAGAAGPVAEMIYYLGIRPGARPVTAFRGECVLVRRSAYEFIGGHAAVLNSVADDLKLAELAVRHRLKFGVARAAGLGHVEFRDGAEATRRAGYKLLLVERAWLRMGAVTAMALWPPALVWAAMDGQVIAASVMFIAPLALALAWYRSALAVLMPLAVYPVAARLWSGLFSALGGSGVEWKGREI